jgi:hypothetical protein
MNFWGPGKECYDLVMKCLPKGSYMEGWSPVARSSHQELIGLGAMAHICNPSYSGSRDQEDHSLKSTWANSS